LIRIPKNATTLLLEWRIFLLHFTTGQATDNSKQPEKMRYELVSDKKIQKRSAKPRKISQKQLRTLFFQKATT
jgi:hypothetical protein